MKNLKSILIFPVLLAAGMLSAPLYAQQKADDTTCARQVSASTLGEPAEPATPEADKYWDGKFYIKTNLPAWIMLWSNAAIEADIAPHWTGGFSLYYSGLNYFTGHIKFRTFTVMPEIRYFSVRTIPAGSVRPAPEWLIIM